MIFYENNYTDPFLNLAAEEVLLRDTTLNEPVFLLWRNRPVVVVGRHQNTIEEINRRAVTEHDVRVVRRLTGGGAVYHDWGNLNYSFILPDNGIAFDFSRFSKPVIAALARLGIKAKLSGRNDLEIDGRKCSGAAQARICGRLLHHGTLLFNTDLDMLSRVLNVLPAKIESKAVASVRARVTNIVDYLPVGVCSNIESFKHVVFDEIASAGAMTVKSFDDRTLEKIVTLRDKKYVTWDWNFGHSPPCNFRFFRRFDWGCVDVRLSVRHGIIESCCFYGDFFAGNEVDILTQRMKGMRFDYSTAMSTLDDELIRSVFPQWNLAGLCVLLFD
ncbi:MAG: lipoate--protein ligase [Planctomycetia bacterium]|nr:lipoate--protein ligase [Planctomycetia bacterium]